MDLRKRLHGAGGRLLAVLLIYVFGSALLLSLQLSVFFIRSIWPDLIAAAKNGESLNVAVLQVQLAVYMASHADLVALCSHITMCLCALLGTWIMAVFLKRDGRGLTTLYSGKSFSWSLVGLAVLAAFALNYVASFILMGTEFLFNLFGLSVVLAEDASHDAVYYIYALLIAPVAEELMFRGGILTTLKPQGEKFALTASAVCFAFFHGNLSQFPTALLMGLLLGWVCLRTDSLLPCTLTHIGYNAMCVLAPLLTERTPYAALPLMLLGLAAGAWAIWRLRGRLLPVPRDDTPREVRLSFYSSFPALMYWVICLYCIVQCVYDI